MRQRLLLSVLHKRGQPPTKTWSCHVAGPSHSLLFTHLRNTRPLKAGTAQAPASGPLLGSPPEQTIACDHLNPRLLSVTAVFTAEGKLEQLVVIYWTVLGCLSEAWPLLLLFPRWQILNFELI